MRSTSRDDDTTMADMFRSRRLASSAKREKNREASTQLLRDRGVFFTSHNDDSHLIVADKWDFWPGTGRWKERKGIAGQAKREGHGVLNLIELVETERTGP